MKQSTSCRDGHGWLVDGRRPDVGGSLKAYSGGVPPDMVPVCPWWTQEWEPPWNFRCEMGKAVLDDSSVLERDARHALWGTFMIEKCVGQITESYIEYRQRRRVFRLAPAVRDCVEKLSVSCITAGTDIGTELTGLLAFHDQVKWKAVAERPA